MRSIEKTLKNTYRTFLFPIDPSKAEFPKGQTVGNRGECIGMKGEGCSFWLFT